MKFSCDNIQEPSIRKKLDRINKIQSLATPPLCLPNIHPKEKLESPPQFVASTDGTIVPMLSAPAMNCGMSVFTTSLTKNDFSPEFLETFAKNIRKGAGPRRTSIEAFLTWFGWKDTHQSRYDLSVSELENIFLYGAPAAIKKYNLPEQELEHIEYGGSVLTEKERHAIQLNTIIPRSSYSNARHEMGYNFGGNHFLEFHTVEHIVNPHKAQALGLKEGQLLLFYHGGGGHATYHLGRYFARRKKNTPFQKFALFWLKALFHFSSTEGLQRFHLRWRYYFSRKPYPEIPLDSPEGQRLWQSIQLALNYGYAFRVALLRRITDALPHGTVSFFWDAAHNSIRKELIDGQEMIVHRQDAVRVFPDKPIMITGLATTLGCIGVGREGAQQSMWSATPSATKVIDEYIRAGRSIKELPTRVSYISKRKEPKLIVKEHMTSEGLFDVVEKLEKENIIEAVAYIRPLGGIKGH
ncbi:MAG: RtcB family protein [Patescibacteria group bacterium]